MLHVWQPSGSASVSLSASLTSTETTTSCSSRKCWRSSFPEWTHHRTLWDSNGIKSKHRAGMRQKKKSTNPFPGSWMQFSEVMMRLPWDTEPSLRGTEGSGKQRVRQNTLTHRVWLDLVYFGVSQMIFCITSWKHVKWPTVWFGPDETHQQIDAFFPYQRSVLHSLAAWGEDVGTLTGRGLHVGQTEWAQVLRTLLHFQLVTLTCYILIKKRQCFFKSFNLQTAVYYSLSVCLDSQRK